jgi:hypothetical protein
LTATKLCRLILLAIGNTTNRALESNPVTTPSPYAATFPNPTTTKLAANNTPKSTKTTQNRKHPVVQGTNDDLLQKATNTTKYSCNKALQ